jgi:hypothetical protein
MILVMKIFVFTSEPISYISDVWDMNGTVRIAPGSSTIHVSV